MCQVDEAGKIAEAAEANQSGNGVMGSGQGKQQPDKGVNPEFTVR